MAEDVEIRIINIHNIEVHGQVNGDILGAWHKVVVLHLCGVGVLVAG